VRIKRIQEGAQGVVQITPEEGSSFFTRSYYCLEIIRKSDSVDPFTAASILNTESLFEYLLNSNIDAEILLKASLTFIIEKKVLALLARSEQTAFMLEQKMIKKEYPLHLIKLVISYLLSIGIIDDARYASLFASSRQKLNPVGKQKLISLLMQKGVSSEIAKQTAVSVFLDDDCYKKVLSVLEKGFDRHDFTHEEAQKFLQRKGYSFSEIRKILALFLKIEI